MLQSWTFPQDSSGVTWVTQAWTLSVELFFYLTFPALFFVVKRCSLRTATAVAAVMACLIIAFGLSSITPGYHGAAVLPGGVNLPLPVLRTAEFVFGIMLCRIRLLYPTAPKMISGSVAGLVLTVLIGVGLMFAKDVHSKAVITVLLGLLIFHLSYETGVVSAFLSGKTVVLLGCASYAMYLLQGPVRAWCETLIKHPFDKFASPIIVIGGAIVVFLYYEQPARKFILTTYRSIAGKKPAPRAAVE